MLSKETLERYRRMTPGERLKVTFDLMESPLADAGKGEDQVVAKRYEKIRADNDARNQNMLTALAKLRRTT
ncbi:MAG: hypothetical protein QM811_04930 [Pirellulales bacterium]